MIQEHIEECLSKGEAKDAEDSTLPSVVVQSRADTLSSPSPLKQRNTTSSAVSTPSKGTKRPSTDETKISLSAERKVVNDRRPLAERMRPVSFDDLTVRFLHLPYTREIVIFLVKARLFAHFSPRTLLPQ